jgi:hypothetical protein
MDTQYVKGMQMAHSQMVVFNAISPLLSAKIYFFGAFSPPNTNASTAIIAVPPVRYATSLPAHQKSEQNTIGPVALPNCPQLLNAPRTFPLSPSCASKLPKLFSPVTTVADVTANKAPAPYRPGCVCTYARRKNASVQEMTPIRTTVKGGNRRTMLPCKIAAMRPTKPRRRPLSFEGLG